MRRIGLAAVLLLGLAQAASAADMTTLTEIYREIPERYIYGISRDNLASLLLKGLHGVDKKLNVGDDDSYFTLYYNGKNIASYRKPSEDDVSGWAELSAEIIDEAAQRSPKAAQQEFELADLMMREAVKGLDKDSKFYLNPEERNAKRLKHRRNFAARQEGDNLYLRLGALNVQSKKNIEETLKEYPQVKGIILDLRGSPGGNLSEAVAIADLFLDEGVIASSRGKGETVYYNAEDGDVSNGLPMAVLVDGATASAAEVLAAALQEQGRAKVIGSGTFGKGTIQDLVTFGSGSVLAVTSAFLYTPSGIPLRKGGVIPDVCTYEMPDFKSAEKLLEQQKGGLCGAEKRDTSPLELETALFLLKKEQN